MPLFALYMQELPTCGYKYSIWIWIFVLFLNAAKNSSAKNCKSQTFKWQLMLNEEGFALVIGFLIMCTVKTTFPGVLGTFFVGVGF